jgi:hypothetical protein
MAVIHNTTLTPGKLELLAAWLPAQPWYRGRGTPVLGRAGGFRLDDPDGAVGIEFMVVADSASGADLCYQVPLTYRGAPLAGAEPALIGTAEHGVLGLRYVYDGAMDPVLAGQLTALLLGRVTAQAQRVSDTPDPSVTASYDGAELAAIEPPQVTSGPAGTDIGLAGGGVLRIIRELTPGPPAAGLPAAGRAGVGQAGAGRLVAGWTGPDGSEHRGIFAVVRPAAG